MKSRAELIDPLESSPFGDVNWFHAESGWSQDKIARLCRLGLVPGAMQSQPGIQGSKWTFRKSKTLKWLRSLERK
jgi:hypothetical protein